MTAPGEPWETLGMRIAQVDRAGKAPLELARRTSDGAFGLVRQIGRDWHRHGPTVTLAGAMRVAEHIAAGNPQALTWPHAQLTMAIGLLVFEWLAGAPDLPGVPVAIPPDPPPVPEPAAAPV